MSVNVDDRHAPQPLAVLLGGGATPRKRGKMSPVAHRSAMSPKLRRTLVTVCAMTATIMQALDTTIANVALPYMQGSLSASHDQINWVLTSYIVASAIMTAPIGWLADRFGRKKLFIVCVAGFTVASLLCATGAEHRADRALSPVAGHGGRRAGAAVAGRAARFLHASRSARARWRSGASA